ncbi:CTD kinase subunit alpha [Plectosphaerella cucumerina]|uniref:cyclin-dependent kinase n=1 Tax=Plectosphaerella cucumerina TaxID=40658 RepID=A0A8K0TEM1_9PEZI|nr:CTD kinase subunit alpha [Plectosphaerella cucumerina]
MAGRGHRGGPGARHQGGSYTSNAGYNDQRQSPHPTPNNYHKSPHDSPYGRGGRNGSPHHQHAQTGQQGQQPINSTYSPPPASAPTGPMQPFSRGNYRGGGGSFRGNQFSQGRGAYRGNNFKSTHWNSASQANGGRGFSQVDDAAATRQTGAPTSRPENGESTDGQSNPFRPSKDMRVEDLSSSEKQTEEDMPPPTRAPPTGPASQNTASSKFSFAFKASSKHTPAAPKPEISQKFNAPPPKQEVAQQRDSREAERSSGHRSSDRRDHRDSRDARDDARERRHSDARHQDRRPSDTRHQEGRQYESRPNNDRQRDKQDRGVPQGAPTEPASARGRHDPGRQPPSGPKTTVPPMPKTRVVQKKMKRLKPRQVLPDDLINSDSVYFRKPGNESVVGSGTYGKVFKGLHVYTKKLVALKRIRMEGEKDGFPVTAVREIKLLQSLRHPNIVQLQEVMVEKNDCFMVFEYLSHDLTGLLNHPTFKLDAAQRKHLAKQIFEGLDYLHVRGVLHRDLKAANILVSSDGILKIADFGLARFYAKRHQLDYTNRVITIWYRSPELLLGETQYGPACDLWSTACILMEIFTRHATFPGDGTEANQLDKIFSVVGTPNTAEWPGLVDMPWFELLRPNYRRANSFAAKYKDRLTPAAYDLVCSIFQYDPAKRPSAGESLAHPYFTTEDPPARQAVELANIDGEWHELESKAHRKENERKEREARHAARKDGRDSKGRDKDRKRENETHDQRGDPKRVHVEGKPPQPPKGQTADSQTTVQA